MTTYNVVWTERMATNVEAKNEAEAIKKVMQCKYNEVSA